MDIEPRKYVNAGIPVIENFCFMIMPFNKRFDDIYGRIKEALRKESYACMRGDEIADNTVIMSTILENIKKAQCIIVDITGQNANVLYELGVAHCLKQEQNVIIITENEEDVPHDIKHIRYIKYDRDNPFALTANILKTIEERQKYFSFQKSLKSRNVISYLGEDSDGAVEFLQRALNNHLNIISAILDRTSDKLPKDQIEKCFSDYISVLGCQLQKGNDLLIHVLLKIFALLLVECQHDDLVDLYVNKLIGNDFFSTHSTRNESERESWQIDLLLALVNGKKMIQTTINWIISYFRRSKATTIDLNRHKLERFLLETTNPAFVNAMVLALQNDDAHIREHMADIIGERRLNEAKPYLVAALRKEENFYSASSIIAALGKLETWDESLDAIQSWIRSNIKAPIDIMKASVLRRAMRALDLLDCTPKRQYATPFNNKYSNDIKRYFPNVPLYRGKDE